MTKILAHKITNTTFSLVPVKYGINFPAAMGIFVWAMKQAWYYNRNYAVTMIVITITNTILLHKFFALHQTIHQNDHIFGSKANLDQFFRHNYHIEIEYNFLANSP